MCVPDDVEGGVVVVDLSTACCHLDELLDDLRPAQLVGFPNYLRGNPEGLLVDKVLKSA